MMNEDVFWDLIERARQSAGNDTEQRSAELEHLLMQLSLEEVKAFDQRYGALLDEAYRWNLWGAAYVMMGGCSDDGFQYFRDWLISEGRERFEAALADPESLADGPVSDEPELELFGYAASNAYEALGGGEIDREVSEIERDGPAGEPWQEDEVAELFPRLAEAYGFD
jgi:hypothetical protein